jgi:MFS family permease
MKTDPPGPSPVAARHASPRENPWWIPPFLGGVPPVSPAQLRLLGLVTLGVFFEQYDLSLLSSAVRHISQDLEIGMSESGYYLSAIRFGGLLTFAVVPFADRVGRRRIFMLSLAAMSLGTLASGLSQTAFQFTLAQMLARAFMHSSVAVAVVMLAEEFPAAHRGWAIGVMGAVGGFGFGLGAAVFAAIDILPYGWRAMYVIGIIPVLLLPALRRDLVETERFRAHREASGEGSAGLGSVLMLAREYPRRALVLGAAGLFTAMGIIAIFQYASWFVREVHGFEPYQYSLMVVMGGGVGIVGNVVAGRLGDRFGRRRIGVAAYAFFPLCAVAFFYGPTGALWLGFAAVVFLNSSGEVILRALSSELFPTSQRAAASSWLVVVQVLGWTLGLFIVGLRTEEIGDLSFTVAALSLATVASAVCLLALPETRGRELEEIAASPGAEPDS